MTSETENKKEDSMFQRMMKKVPQKSGLFWFMAALLFMLFMGNHEEVVIVAIVFSAVSAWIFVPMWLKHKRELEKHALMTTQPKNPQDEAKSKKLEERLQNLEALLCRLDSEMNYHLERTLSSGKLITTSDAAGVSQMPTTFLNVASVLEGRYQILKELGRGGMGIVFQAYDKQLNEQVAIKILSPLLSNDSDALERLKREVSAARRITHPNVIRIYDIAEKNGLHFVSMEYFHGRSLKEYVRSTGSLSSMQVWNIASQICSALEAAHREGIIHRDLKSQNVIVDSANRVKVIDFGLARTAHLEGMTATGLIMGTPEYMSPEQVGAKRVDERSDIYSMGIILYELFTGRVPFTAESAIAVGFMQLKEVPVPPRQINGQISPEVEQVILKALEKDPSHRHRSITDLKDDLEKAILRPESVRLPEVSPVAAQVEKIRS